MMMLMCVLVHQRTASLRTVEGRCEMYGGTIQVANTAVFRVQRSTCEPEKRSQNMQMKELFVASCLGRARCVRCARCALYSRHSTQKGEAAKRHPRPHFQGYHRTKAGNMPLPVTFWISFGECNNALWLCISYLTGNVNTSIRLMGALEICHKVLLFVQSQIPHVLSR